MASSSAAEIGTRVFSDRGTLPEALISFALAQNSATIRLDFGATLCSRGVLIWASGGILFCSARRSSVGLRFMVLLMHVLFVGAVFVLDPTLGRRIHEEPW